MTSPEKKSAKESDDIFTPHSRAELLTIAPRLNGSPQGSFIVARFATHISSLPCPPGREEQKYNSMLSREILGDESQKEVFIGGPRFTAGLQGSFFVWRLDTQLSQSPYPPGRLYASKYSSRSSADRHGQSSRAGLLTAAPRFTGASQSLSFVVRVITQRSVSPKVPGRFEKMYNSKPSAEIQPGKSAYEVLTVGPRFTGSPKAKSAFVGPPPTSIAAIVTVSINLILQASDHFILHRPFCVLPDWTPLSGCPAIRMNGKTGGGGRFDFDSRAVVGEIDVKFPV